MQRKYAVYRKDCSFICDVLASSESEAMVKVKWEHPDACMAVLVCYGGDLGVNGVNHIDLN